MPDARVIAPLTDSGPLPSAIAGLPLELSGPPPRQAPETLYDGPQAQRRKRMLYGFLTAGAMCVALAPLPFMKTMAL
jgi:hypothetical protein